jgi:hypothetical protein
VTRETEHIPVGERETHTEARTEWDELAAAYAEQKDAPTEALASAVLAEHESPELHELAIRDAIARIRVLDRDRTRTKRLAAVISERYREQVKRADAEEAALRDSLVTYLKANGGKAVSFPDVGGVHLTTVNKGGKAKVVDAVAFQVWAEANFTPEQYDACLGERPFLPERALERLDADGVKPTATGNLVHTPTGQVVEVDGVEALAEDKSLVVKGGK